MKTYTEEKRIRPDILTAAVYWSIVIMMLYNVISVCIFGDMGAGFCSATNSLFFLLYVSFVQALQKAVYIMVRLRARRSQFVNAQINMQRSIRIFSLIGVVLSILIGSTSFYVAKNLFGSGKVYFQLIIIAIGLIFLCSQGVVRGYLQGLGYTRPIVIADIIIAAFSFASGAVISAIMFGYGKKVNELFHGNEYSAIYGASGMMIGLLIGCLVGFLQILVSFFLRKNEIGQIIKEGAPRYLDNKNDVITGVRPIMYLYASPVLMCLVDNIAFYVVQMKNGNSDTMVISYGAYAGRVISLAILVAFLCCIPYIKSWNRVMARVERDEFEGARDRLKKLIHFSLMLLIPVSIGFFVASEPFQLAIYGKSSSGIDGIFALVAVFIPLLAIAIFSSWLLNHMGKNLLIVVVLSVSWAVHVVAMIIFMAARKQQLLGVALAQMLAFLVYDVFSVYLILKMLKIRVNLLNNVGIPVACAAISGLIFFAEIRILSGVIGEILTLLIGVVIYTVVYVVIMIALKGVKTEELERIPLGKFLLTFSSKVQHDKFYEE